MTPPHRRRIFAFLTILALPPCAWLVACGRQSPAGDSSRAAGQAASSAAPKTPLDGAPAVAPAQSPRRVAAIASSPPTGALGALLDSLGTARQRAQTGTVVGGGVVDVPVSEATLLGVWQQIAQPGVQPTPDQALAQVLTKILKEEGGQQVVLLQENGGFALRWFPQLVTRDGGCPPTNVCSPGCDMTQQNCGLLWGLDQECAACCSAMCMILADCDGGSPGAGSNAEPFDTASLARMVPPNTMAYVVDNRLFTEAICPTSPRPAARQ
jgi:hypothetical protein